MNKSTWMTMLLAVCFTLLQVLQPFIHAHVEQHQPHDTPDHHAHAHHQVGFHVAEAHEEVYAPDAQHHAAFSRVPHASHTIFVTPAIPQQADKIGVFNAPLLALYCLVMALILLAISPHYFPWFNLHFPSTKRRLPAPRAPPF